MTDAATAARPSALDVLIARVEAKATLWVAGEISLHDAVDELWHEAMRDGLVAELGPDEVQWILSDAFAPERDDLPWDDDVSDENINFEDSTFAAACEAADEKQRRRPSDPQLEKLRRLMDGDVSLERAWAELNTHTQGDVPTATLRTAEFLLKEKDPARMRAWLAKHSAQERAAILRHLEQRRGVK